MNRSRGKCNPPEDKQSDGHTGERRRIAQIVHDHRGTAIVEWHDGPAGMQRQKFEIEDTQGSGRGDTKLRGGLTLEAVRGGLTLEPEKEDTFNPYDRNPDTFAGRPGTNSGPKGGKRDLRKLSEWLKMMRAVEEQKKNGGGEE